MRRHAPMGKDELTAILKHMLGSVEAGDSFEGSIEYLMPGPLVEPCPDDTNGDGDCGKPACPHCGEGTWAARMRDAEFAVMGSYRVGNLMGQGGVRLIGEDEPLTESELPPAVTEAVRFLAKWAVENADPDFESPARLRAWTEGAILAQITDPDYEQAREVTFENGDEP